MNIIKLKNNRGFRWYNSGNIYVKGYLFDRNSKFYHHENLLDYFRNVQYFPDLEDKVKSASGCFSVIIKKDTECLIATDIIRTFPLFYAKKDDDWIISDDAYFLAELTGKTELNKIACHEFLAAGYVTGSETLLKDIRQVQAGEILSLSGEDVRKKFYFTFRSIGILEFEYEDLRSILIKLLDKVFKKFIDSLNGNVVCVSLSGGFDSRLIAVMLKKFHYDKVICMSYGRKDNPEMTLAEKTAAELGFQWININYTNDMIHNYMDNEFLDFYKYSSNLTSMFFMQDYFAAKYLKENKIIPDSAIIATGHAGDFLAGSQLNKHGNIFSEESLRGIADRIYRIKYNYKQPPSSVKEKLIQRIEKSISEKFTGNKDLAFSIHEDWDFKEKLAKFNFNSINTYSFFGYEFRFPFWDQDLIEFFRDLPLEARMNKYMYNDVLINDYFSQYNLNFNRELLLDEKMIKKLKIKNLIKHFLPEAIKRLFIQRNDNIFYREITNYMVLDAQKKGYKLKTYGNSYNSIIIQWYLNKTKEWAETLKNI